MDDVTVNLIDTPGHPDFIAEVERVLSVLDGAVLVISAVEGVQAQTRILMRALQRLRIPTLIFVNKVDRGGAREAQVLRDISERLTPAIVAMGSVTSLGTRAATYAPYRFDDAFAARLVDVLVGNDDTLLATFVDDENKITERRLRDELASQTKRAIVHPVFFGSAITGAGVDPLRSGITAFLPATEGDSEGPVSGSVFKVERGAAGEKIAYVRMFSGTVRTRERLRFGRGREDKITAISVFERGSVIRRAAVSAGQIGRLWGLADVQIGDVIGETRTSSADERHFAPPTLESVVEPMRPADRGSLHAALTQLAEQDPLINLRIDDLRQEIAVSLYGEVQKEVIQSTLADSFGIDVTLRKTTTICIERLIGSGAAVEIMGKEANPVLATVGLRVDPALVGSGVEFRLGIELGAMPLAFLKAVEDTVRATLEQGIYGWAVTDCIVTMTHSGYAPRQSHAHATFDKSMSSTGADFRGLTPLVLMRALQRARTQVHEPIHRFKLELPADALGPVLPALAASSPYVARSRPGRGQTTTRSTARSTCCA